MEKGKGNLKKALQGYKRPVCKKAPPDVWDKISRELDQKEKDVPTPGPKPGNKASGAALATGLAALALLAWLVLGKGPKTKGPALPEPPTAGLDSASADTAQNRNIIKADTIIKRTYVIPKK